MTHEQIVINFYRAFANKEAEKMVSYYAESVVFNDPVFKNLKGEEAKDMWRMLLSSAKNLSISHSKVKSISGTNQVRANWEAIYYFSKTGNKVHNKISATFEIEDGKIIRHTDKFDLWKWAGMALGMSGKLLGWTTFVQNKIRAAAQKSLNIYRTKK